MTVRSLKTKKTPAKTVQKRKPGVTMKSKSKATLHILWRGKQITEFESRVYELISKIPAGKKNPFAPEVPCHRVVAATLDIGGFQGATGEDSPCIQKKRTLLAKEGVRFTKEHKVMHCAVPYCDTFTAC